MRRTSAAVNGAIFLRLCLGNAVKYDEAYNADFIFGGVKPEDVTMAMEPPTLPDETGNYPIPIPGQTRFIV